MKTHAQLRAEMNSPEGQAKFAAMRAEMNSPEGQATFARMREEMNSPESQATFARMRAEMRGETPPVVQDHARLNSPDVIEGVWEVIN